MSKENVELVREAADAVSRRDPDTLIACLRPDVEWEENSDVPGLRGLYRGWVQVREWLEDLWEAWDSFQVELVKITELSDGRVLAHARVTARGRGSGVETQLHVWPIFSFADDKIARRQVFWTREQALDAAGLEE